MCIKYILDYYLSWTYFSLQMLSLIPLSSTEREPFAYSTPIVDGVPILKFRNIISNTF